MIYIWKDLFFRFFSKFIYSTIGMSEIRLPFQMIDEGRLAQVRADLSNKSAFDWQLFSTDQILYILNFLGVPDLGSFSLVAKYSNRLFFSEILWVKFYESESAKNPSLGCSMESFSFQKTIKSWREVENWTCVKLRDTSEQHCAPSPRFLHRMTKMELTNELYVFGGKGKEENPYKDLFCVRIHENTVVTRFLSIAEDAPNPEARYAASLCSYDKWLVLFGGARDSFGPFYNDLWFFNTETTRWKCFEIPGQATENNHENGEPSAACPSQRWAHTMLPHGNTFILFGGSSPGKCFNDTWVLKIKEKSNISGDDINACWEQVVTTGTLPAGRSGHAAAVYQDNMYIFGGNTLSETFNDLYRLNLLSFCWECIQVAHNFQPSPRIGHSMVALDGKLIIYGGRDIHKRKMQRGLAVFYLHNLTWKNYELHTESVTSLRTGHSTVLFPGGCLVFGGLFPKKGAEAFSNEFCFLKF